MYRALLVLMVFTLGAFSVNAQGAFRGVVVEDSLSKTPIYQASVKVVENGTMVATLYTYFDGSFTYTTQKGKVYEFTATVPGTKDVMVSVTTDKRGTPAPLSAYFVMRKDGLRLVGVVKDINNNMPIDKADVVLKDVQTREETRFTTNLDGRYNLKLKYETNYRISIDKRSIGIANRYEDTVFFVSTVGFNQPLDYELDIALRKAQQLTNRTDYIPTPSKPASKPVVEVKAPVQQTPPPAETKPVVKETPKPSEIKPVVKEAPKQEPKAQPEPPKAMAKEVPKQEPKPEQPAPQKPKQAEVEMPDKPIKDLEKEQKRAAKEKAAQEKLAAKAAAQKAKEEAKLAKEKAKIDALAAKETAKKEKEAQKLAAKQKQQQPVAPVITPATPQKENEDVAARVKEKLEQKMQQPQTTPVAPAPSRIAPANTVIYFAKNAAYITDFSKAKLEAALARLKANPKAKIVLSCHAGKEEKDVADLCLRRLSSAKYLFTSNGIGVDRITTKNNGNSVPANDCHIKGNCSEQLLILNRRMEIQVVE